MPTVHPQRPVPGSQLPARSSTASATTAAPSAARSARSAASRSRSGRSSTATATRTSPSARSPGLKTYTNLTCKRGCDRPRRVLELDQEGPRRPGPARRRLDHPAGREPGRGDALELLARLAVQVHRADLQRGQQRDRHGDARDLRRRAVPGRLTSRSRPCRIPRRDNGATSSPWRECATSALIGPTKRSSRATRLVCPSVERTSLTSTRATSCSSTYRPIPSSRTTSITSSASWSMP